MPGHQISRKTLVGGAAAALAAVALAIPAFGDTLEYPAEAFDKVDVSTGLVVEFTPGDTHSVTATFERGSADDVIVDVKGSTLVVRRKSRGLGWGGSKVNATFTVTAPDLVGVEASSGSIFKGIDIDSERISVDASSGASVYLDGRCGSVYAEASSGSSINGEGLRCADGVLDTSSGASLRVALSESMAAEASSGSSIRVKGNPDVVRRDKSSGASITVTPAAL